MNKESFIIRLTHLTDNNAAMQYSQTLFSSSLQTLSFNFLSLYYHYAHGIIITLFDPFSKGD